MRFFYFSTKCYYLLSYLVYSSIGVTTGKQEYSSRTLGATWGIISAIMVPIIIVLICVGWRILLRRKQEEHDESDFMPIKSRPVDPDESMKINSDDDSIPYKKDIEDSPEPTDPVRVVDSDPGYPYQSESTSPQQSQGRNWAGETEIN